MAASGIVVRATSAVEPESAPFTPVTTDAAGTVFQCLLCGLRFTHGGLVCGGCPLRRGCDLVACPGCSYTFPRSSRLVEWAKRLLRRGRSRPP
jgi:hypothetical protein